MDRRSFFGNDIQYKIATFNDGHSDFMVNLLANKIVTSLVNRIGQANICSHYAILENKNTDNHILKHYRGFVVSKDEYKYKVFLNAFIPILISSYSISERILTEAEYKEVMEFRWGLNFDYGHPLNSEMFVFSMPIDKPLTKINIEESAYIILADFYDPCGGMLRNYETSSGFLREEYSLKDKTPPRINLLIGYSYILDLLFVDPNNIPNGLDVNLPIFYLSSSGYTYAVTPIHFEKSVIEAIQNNEVIPYYAYSSIMEEIKTKISEFSE